MVESRNVIIQEIARLQELYLKNLEDYSTTTIEELKPMYQNMKSIQEMVTRHFIEFLSVRMFEKEPESTNENDIDDVTIKNLIDAIHFTIIDKRGSNPYLKEINGLYHLISRGEIENYSVLDTEYFKDYIKFIKEKL